MRLHIDIETYSSVDLLKSGVYKYVESDDFEILIFCYAYNDGPVHRVSLAQGEEIPGKVKKDLQDIQIIKVAHNAQFERLCLSKYGFKTLPENWDCTLVKCAYHGLPLSLAAAGKALNLDVQKDKRGKALITIFSKPTTPTKSNGGRTRTLPEHDPEAFEEYIQYCERDVEVEQLIDKTLGDVHPFDLYLYEIDQRINDKGIEIDLDFVNRCIEIDYKNTIALMDEMKAITGAENPNSPKQLKDWLEQQLGEEVQSLAKDTILEMLDQLPLGPVRRLLELRLKAAKSSIKKYQAMINCVGNDNRARGLFQFLGANRTGRWAGRLIQMQNLPRIYFNEKDIAFYRSIIMGHKYETIKIFDEDVSGMLSQMIRTAFVAPKDKSFVAADFSAIEARVLAWVANEDWRMEVFRSHGKIYEASAAQMFNVPIESIGKGSELRTRGKVAELALGYQGSIGAMMQMGADKMGLSEVEMKDIVYKWRNANPNIKKYWDSVERASILCIKDHRRISYRGLVFEFDGEHFTIQLPSGKKLWYRDAELTLNKWDKLSVRYKNMENGRWSWTETYGGKLTENIVQAIARDLLGYSMMQLYKKKYDIVLHVHDEVVVEVEEEKGEQALIDICDILGKPPTWANDLPLSAEGYVSSYYKKD